MNRIDHLRAEIARHDDLFFRKATPEISDSAYDALKREFEALGGDADNGDDSSEGFSKVVHSRRMKSLEKAYDAPAIERFLRAAFRANPGKALTFSVTTKYDGLAVCAHYRDGRLARLATRGNGDSGDDITMNAHIIDGLPQTLPAGASGDGELRGEAYMLRAVFEKVKASAQGKDYKNPRNLAAGVLKTLALAKDDPRRLSFACYEAPEGFDMPALHGDRFTATDADAALAEAMRRIEAIGDARAALPYDIDGAVLAIEGRADREATDAALGELNKFPRWAISFKFDAIQAQTVVERIIFQIGRTGAVAPVALLKPVDLAGSTVARATLHNASEIARKDIREGDTVLIEKGGDIIPKVVVVLKEFRGDASVPFDFEARLKELGLDASRVPGQAGHKLNAPGRETRIRALTYFMSKPCLDVTDFGPSVAEAIVDALPDASPVSVFCNPAAALSAAGIGGKTFDNLMAAFSAAKAGAKLNRVIQALGIPNVGENGSKILAKRYGNLSALLGATSDELLALRDVGPITALSVTQWLANPANAEAVALFVREGADPQQEAAGTSLSGKVFVITGTLPNLKRAQAQGMIEKAGGSVSGSVSAKTHFVVAGEDAGSKLEKAAKLGVTVLDEAGLLALLSR